MDSGLRRNDMLRWKQMGFSDVKLAELSGSTPEAIRTLRHTQGIKPVFKRVDTCAAEFESGTPYMYSTYWGSENRAIGCESKRFRTPTPLTFRSACRPLNSRRRRPRGG